MTAKRADSDERLAKLLAMAESDVDGEALSALRLAAKSLAKTGLRLRDLASRDLPKPWPLRTHDESAMAATLRQAKLENAALTRDLTGAQTERNRALAARNQAISARRNAEARRDQSERELLRAREQLAAAKTKAARDTAAPETGRSAPIQQDAAAAGPGARDAYRNRHERPEFADWRTASKQGVTIQDVRRRKRNLAV